MKSTLMDILIIASLAATALSRDYTWGKRVSGDQLLENQDIVARAKKGSLNSVNYVFPRNGHTNNLVISAIHVVDHFENNRRVTATLRKGGPKFKFVAINLRSQINMGFNATVSIFGKKQGKSSVIKKFL